LERGNFFGGYLSNAYYLGFKINFSIERRLKMSEELLGKIILIIFVVVLLITDWKDIWLKKGD